MTAERQQLIVEALGRKPETILEIDVGYDFEVAIVDDDWVFRFPCRSGVEEALELETLLLPALAPSLPVLVPTFEYVSHNPFFVGYRVIRGEPLVDENGEGSERSSTRFMLLTRARFQSRLRTGSRLTATNAQSSNGSSSPCSTATSAPEQGGSSGTSRRSRASNPPSSTQILVLSTCSCETAVSSA
jgi:hypothetical protein